MIHLWRRPQVENPLSDTLRRAGKKLPLDPPTKLEGEMLLVGKPAQTGFVN